MSTNKPFKPFPPDHDGPDLHGASVIDESGVERPITETMIQRSLDELDIAWFAETARRRLRRHQRQQADAAKRRRRRLGHPTA